MELCLFNPSHDIALAYGNKPFTPPKIAVDMEKLDIARYWATDNCQTSHGFSHITEVKPWGWDHYLRKKLIKEGISEEILPTIQQLDRIRDLSSRKNFVPLLRQLRMSIPQTIGEAEYTDELPVNREGNKKFVIKAPWSSSGRGVRIYDSQNNAEKTLAWARNIIKNQGGVTIEPYYDKVKDLAMEFEYMPNEGVMYLGLSLFSNIGNSMAYSGNVIASEEKKQELLRENIDIELTNRVREHLIEKMNKILRPLYVEDGFKWNLPFGVDMMIVEKEGVRCLHPCVEVNLRRTMGYVAIKIYDKIYRDEKDFFGYFSVDAVNGKCTICEQGMVPGQW